MLGTIAALYAVASSWLPVPPPSEYSDTVPGPTKGCDDDVACGAQLSPALNRPTQGDTDACSRTSTSLPSAAADCDHMSGIADRDVRTTGVNTLPFSGVKRSGNASMSPDAVSTPLNSSGGGGGSGPAHFTDRHRREQPSLSGVRGAAGDGRGKRDDAYAVADLAGENAARDPRQTDKAKRGQRGEPLADYAATQHPCFSSTSRPQPRFIDDGSYGEDRSPSSGTMGPPLGFYGQGKAGSPNAATFRAQAINLASKEYAKLRDRAERAERMLEITRGRLCRARDDGASSAAAAAAATTTAAAADHVEDDGDDYGDGSDDSGKYVAPDTRHREDEPVLTCRRGSRRRHRERSAERVAPITAATAAKPIFRRSSSVDGSGFEKHDSPTRNFGSASSSDIWDGQGHYHTDDAGEPRRRPARGQIGQRGRKEHRRRRRHSSSRCTSSSEARPEERGQGGEREGSDGERKDGGGEPKRRRSKRRQQLRASDLTRMREVIARLRITTAELEAERAHRLDAPSAGVMERGAHSPSVNAVYAGGDDSSMSRQVGGEGRGPSEEGVEAAALQRENANLRRKLFGLMALEELEGRAVEKGLLPLTGGGVSGGDFFSYSDKK